MLCFVYYSRFFLSYSCSLCSYITLDYLYLTLVLYTHLLLLLLLLLFLP